MLSNSIRKTDKINLILIFTYSLVIFVTLTQKPLGESFLYLVVDLIFSLVTLLVMNHLLKHEPIAHRSPFYYYTFLTLVTMTIYIDGGYTSDLFPALLILPVLYTVINFSRKGSTAITIFAVLVIWMTLIQDLALTKLYQSIIMSIIIIAMPHSLGLLVKEYVYNMKRLIKKNRAVYFHNDKF